MKLNYMYFSPTGGTKKVVELISKTWDCEKSDIDLSIYRNDYSLYSFAAKDLCVIGVPSFGGRVPAIALEHLRMMKADNTPTVLIVTYGNRDYDDTLLELKDAVSQSGFRVIAAIASVTEHSIMHQFGTGRPDESDEKELCEYAKKIQQALLTPTALPEVAVKGNRPYKEYKGVPFKPDTDKNCTKCGACVKVCPVGAIPSMDPSTTQKEQCISCMRCISICPQKARKLNPLILFAASKKMKKSCSGRKENEFFFK